MAGTGCARTSREPLLTFFNGDLGLSVRYPASWKTEQAQQEGVWYRYFLGPPTGPQRKPAVSVTLLAGPLGGTLEDYAQTYLAGNTLVSSRDESRQGAGGKSYQFASADGASRHLLLLLQEENRVYGLYAQGERALFERHAEVLDEMARSLALERPATYPEVKNEKYGFSLRVPPSWRSTQTFSGGGAFLTQYSSPALAADRNRQTVHASLTVSVEPVGEDGSLDTYYKAVRDKLGEPFQVLSHGPWRGGYVDVMRMETPVSSSRVKRFYRAEGGRGYSLSFDARDDVYPRVHRWYDLIASTFRTASEMKEQ